MKSKIENRKSKMQRSGGVYSWFAFTIIALVACSSRAASAGSDNPYQPIVTRNVFGLVPIPVAPPPDPSAAAKDLPKITPNGIMTIFGKLQVLFKVADPGQPAGKEESYVMCEGDRQDEIEVRKIDEKAAMVTFNNHGTVQTLALVEGKASGGAPAAGGSAGGVPRLPNLPGHPVPGASVPAGFGGHFGQAATAGAGSGGAPGLGGAATANNAIQNQETQLTPEAQVIMIEAQRMDAIQKNDPSAPLFPVTELTDQVTGGDAGNGGESNPNPGGP